MKVANTNAFAPQRVAQKRMDFAALIRQEDHQAMLQKVASTPEEAARLTAVLISAVSSSDELKNCNPASVWAAALQGIGEGLIFGQEYSIVAFGERAKFVRGWRGYLALLYATGEVEDADCFPVYDGELVGRDPSTKRKRFDFSVYDTDEEEQQHPLIGYYAYVKKLNGQIIYDYMSIDELLHHADQHVPYFSLATYKKWVRGEQFTEKEKKRIGISYEALTRLRETGEGTDEERKAAGKLGAWYDPGKQPAMLRKTVLIKLMRSGRLRLANSASKASAVIMSMRYGEDGTEVLEAPNASDYLPDAVEAAQDAPDAGKTKEEAPPSPDGQDVIGSFFDGGDAP